MQVFIYRCARRADTYLYLAKRDHFEVVPAPLRERLGAFVAVMALELTPERKLARADAAVVLSNLDARGFYLQAPPSTQLPGDEAW